MEFGPNLHDLDFLQFQLVTLGLRLLLSLHQTVAVRAARSVARLDRCSRVSL